MKWKFFLPAIFLSGMLAYGQEYYPKNDGVKAENDNYTALTGATLHIAPGEVIQNGTLLIRNGEVAQAGASVRIPANAVVFDLKGKHIYPSFIDVFSEYGIAKPKRAQGGGRSADYNPSREGFYWNDHIRPEQEAINAYSYDDKSAGSLRKLGFGAVNSHIPDGVARGTGVTLSLNKEGNENTRVIQQNSGQYFSFQKSVTSRQSYPSSLMGAMALLRQMYYDARWYEGGNSPTTDRALEALNSNKGLVQFFAAGDNGNVLRADGIGDNFGIQYIILAGGREYEDVQAIKATNAALVLPLDFPAAFDVSNPFEADLVSLEDMRHWNQAPSNPKVMADNGVRFAFTLHGLKNNADFHKQIRKAISYGLSEQQALEALTTTPASLLGQSDKIGSLRPGRLANFLITSGSVFSESSTLYENWVRGQRHILSDMDQKDIRGTYSLRAGSQSFTMELSGKAASPKLKIAKDTTDLKGKLSYKGDWIDLSFTDGEDRYRMTGRVSGTSDNIQGPGVLPNGRETRFTARKTAAYDGEKEEAKNRKTNLR